MGKAFLLASAALIVVPGIVRAQTRAPAAAPSLPERPWARDLGIRPGVCQPGPLNAITNLAGVRVGQVTLVSGDNVRTGVTAILPHPGNLFREKVAAAIHVFNAFGKLAGSTRVAELAQLETPILLTNTLSVGDAAAALTDWMLVQPGNEGVLSINPLVGETVAATDAPLDARQLRRLAAQAILGMARAGSTGGHGSGDYVIAFLTTNRIPAGSARGPATPPLGEEALSPLFEAVGEATEEAIDNSLLCASTSRGRDGHSAEAIPFDRLKEILARYNRRP